jgi:Ca2+-binding EF-hand superfamily protein
MELDEDADGFIDKSELVNVLKSFGEPLSDEEIK